MREITRLIALAIVTFAVTALAVFLGNPDVGEALARRIGIMESPAQTGPAPIAGSENVIRVRRPDLGRWIGLEGFPSRVTLRFPLPRDTVVLRGQLHLEIASQLIERGDGLVRILVNGTERDAIVLESGRMERALTFDLNAEDLAAGAVVVTLDGNGTTNQGQICPTNVTNLGAAIEVLPSSALVLQLAKPLSNVAAVLSVLPDPLSIDPSGAPAFAAWSAQWLSRQGVPSQLTPGKSPDTIAVSLASGDPLRTGEAGQPVVAGIAGARMLASLRGAALPATYGAQWPLSVPALTTDLATHTFRGSSRWNLDYKLADLPAGRAAATLDLRLRTGRLQGDNYWTLRVLLNGSLIHSSNQPGTADQIRLNIPLPLDLQGLTNHLTVTLVDNTPNQGICRAGPEAAAQLLPESRLNVAAFPATDKQVLVAALAGMTRLNVGMPEDAGLDAAVALSRLLDLVTRLDADVTFNAENASPTLEAVIGDRISSLLAGAEKPSSQRAYLVLPSQRTRPDGIEVVRLPALATYKSDMLPGAAGLLVTW